VSILQPIQFLFLDVKYDDVLSVLGYMYHGEVHVACPHVCILWPSILGQAQRGYNDDEDPCRAVLSPGCGIVGAKGTVEEGENKGSDTSLANSGPQATLGTPRTRHWEMFYGVVPTSMPPKPPRTLLVWVCPRGVTACDARVDQDGDV
jgi:hypothetical protein